MMRSTFQRLALGLFLLYLAVFPGSTVTLALDRVPVWGTWMGDALLLVQGACALGWLLARYGRQGALAAALIFLFAWGIEHLGVTSGFPFGRYRYTGMLQPQLLGVVPLAIPCAWLMVTVGAWQLARDVRLVSQRKMGFGRVRDSTLSRPAGRIEGCEWRRPAPFDTRSALLRMLCWRQLCVLILNYGDRIRQATVVATLVLLLDLQIETVATAINGYWIWLERGPYYGVPTANFIAWWLVGGGMGLVITHVLREPTTDHRPPTTDHPALEALYVSRFTFHASRFTFHVSRIQQVIPACLYLLSTLMFTAVNLARGYVVAGLVGLAVVLWAVFRFSGVYLATAGGHAARQTSD